MPNVEKVVQVSDKAEAVMKGLVTLVAVSKQAIADGFQLGQDVPLIVTQSAADVIAAVSASQEVGADWAADQAGVEKALALGLVDLKEAILPKK